jgi:predicted membrane protein
MIYKEFKFGGKQNPFGNVGVIIGFILILVLFYFLLKGLYTLLSWISPFLLIGALILDHKVVLDFGKYVLRLLKENTAIGILMVVLCILGFPFLTGMLFFRAFTGRFIKNYIKKSGEAAKPKYSDYEEVESDDIKHDDFLILPKADRRAEAKKDSEYDELFK